MKTLKLLGAALAAVTMTFTAQAAKTAKAVVADGGTTLKFVYDEADYGTKDDAWFSVAEAEAINPDNEDVPWYDKMWSKVTKVVFAESFAAYQPTSVANWFFYFTKLTAVEGVAYWDTSKTTTFYALFANCSGLTTLNLAGLSTASAKNVGSMFNGCTALTTIAATDSFAVPEAARSNNMFKKCTALVGGNGTAFDGNKTNGEYARIDGGPSAPGYFTMPPLVAKAVVENGGETLRFIYDNLDYGEKDVGWFSVAEAEAINPLQDDVPWCDCGATVTKVVFDPSFAAYLPKQCGSWFDGFGVLAAVDGLKNLNTSVATSMAYMFSGCSSLTSLDLTGFDTANVTEMDFMFSGCSSLTTLDVSGFNTANVTDMDFMFSGCSSLEAICASDRFVTDQVSYSSGMFEDCSKLVGGAGTEYDSDKTDATYARIDGKDGQPGYFTRGQMIATGAYASLDLVKDLGIVIPEDVDYAAGDKVTIKVEGLAKGLKVVMTPVYEDPNAKKKVIVDYVYTIEGVPTEAVDFEQQPMFARVTVTYKDKTKGDKGKVETLQPIVLSIATPEPSVLTAGVLNQVYGPADIATLWPEVADAKENPKEWSFKGWPAGLKYNATAKDASWSYKDGKATVKTNAEPWTVYGQPTKAGEYPITATWKHKLADGKTTVSETFSAVLTVWGDVEDEDDFRYEDQAYVATATKTLGETFKSFSGLPTGIKYTTKLIAADAKKGTPEYPAYSLYGTPTKAGVFAVTVTQTDNTKKTFLWKIDPPDAPTFALDTGTAPVEDLKAQIVQGANQSFSIATSDIAAKVTVTGLPTGLKLVATPVKDGTKTIGNTYSVEGVPSKPGEYFVTFKTVLNGVTTVTTTAFTVQGNPFVATYRGYACARPAAGAAVRLGVAEVTVAAAGTVKLTYTEGKTKYTASVKSFDWNDATGKGTAEGLVLKVSSADKKLGYGDRKATLTFEDFGAYVTALLDITDANGFVKSLGFLYASVKTTEVPLPASQTFVFRTKDWPDTNPLATVSVAYDAKNATAAFSGKLYDGTAVKATVPVARWGDDGTSNDYVFAPFLVIAKDGTVYCFDCFSSDEGGGYVDWVSEDGEDTESAVSTPADYTLGDAKFAELVPNTGAFTFNWGSDAEVVGETTESFAFEVTTDTQGNPKGVAIYDADPQPSEKALATVTAKVGKTTGAISVSFTSKKGDKAKYAVELVWRGEELFAGHVTRTWKGVVGNKSANLSASGTVEVK